MEYKELRADFERLEAIRECDDWAWAEERFLELLETPTKKKAAEIYHSLIRQWLAENERNIETEWAYEKYN